MIKSLDLSSNTLGREKRNSVPYSKSTIIKYFPKYDLNYAVAKSKFTSKFLIVEKL